MKPSKVKVTKALTIEKSKRWDREEYTLEVELEEGDDPTVAKQWASSLLDIWIAEFEKS